MRVVLLSLAGPLFLAVSSGPIPDREIPMGDPPVEAVNAALRFFKITNNTRQVYSSGWEYDPESLQVVGAKQIGLDNRNFAPGVEEQWCLAITYVRQNVNQDLPFSPTAFYLTGRFEEDWVSRRTSRASDAYFYNDALQERWDYFCSD